jgi:hypothetical protein
VNVAILIPTLGRAEVLAPLLENIRATTPVGKYRAEFILDWNDMASDRALAQLKWAEDFCCEFCDGTYPEKTNEGYQGSEGDLILPTADDVVFHDGWYEAALKHFEAGAQVVGTNDLTPATRDGRMATMPIVRRSYIEDPGAAWGETETVFHEGLHHNFVDRELWELACHRGVAVFERESVIEHRHHGWQTREVDDTDRKGNMQGWDADKALFEERKAQWLAS